MRAPEVVQRAIEEAAEVEAALRAASGVLFHWSARAARASIEARGLLPFQRERVLPLLGGGEMRCGALPLCFGPTPSAAWAGVDWHRHPAGVWDLWEVRLTEADAVEEFTPGLAGEVRLASPIEPTRLAWVGERTTAEEPQR